MSSTSSGRPSGHRSERSSARKMPEQAVGMCAPARLPQPQKGTLPRYRTGGGVRHRGVRDEETAKETSRGEEPWGQRLLTYRTPDGRGSCTGGGSRLSRRFYSGLDVSGHGYGGHEKMKMRPSSSCSNTARRRSHQRRRRARWTQRVGRGVPHRRVRDRLRRPSATPYLFVTVLLYRAPEGSRSQV